MLPNRYHGKSVYVLVVAGRTDTNDVLMDDDDDGRHHLSGDVPSVVEVVGVHDYTQILVMVNSAPVETNWELFALDLELAHVDNLLDFLWSDSHLNHIDVDVVDDVVEVLLAAVAFANWLLALVVVVVVVVVAMIDH